MNKTNSYHATGNKTSNSSGNLREKETQPNLYATNGSIVKEYINRPENFIEDKVERRQAAVNKYNFISALIDGFSSDGNKRLEINISDSADLSIDQNGGFSVFFWFLCKKQVEGVHRYILKKGNVDEEVTPAIGILPNGTNIFVKMNSTKNKIENLFSNKKIELNRMYSLLVTFSIDYHNDLTDIALYLDGGLDSQVTVPGQPVHNQGNLFIGRGDNINLGFVGCVADVILMPRVIEEVEISQLHKECLINFKANRLIQSYEIFSHKFERDYLIDKYMQNTGNPLYVIENLQLSNDELKEIVKNYDDELRKELEAQSKVQEVENEEAIIYAKLRQFLGDNDSEYSIICKKLATNASFIYTVLHLANDTGDELSTKRIQSVLEILSDALHIKTEETMISNLAKILNSLASNESQVRLFTFFKQLRYYVSFIFPEMKIYEFNEGSVTKSNFATANSLFNEGKSNELHENLLRASQNFKNYFDDDLDKDLTKSSFSIRSLYTRNKSPRPYTSKGFYSERVDDADMVNQDFEDIPENRNALTEVDEEKEDERIVVVNNEDCQEKREEELSSDNNLNEEKLKSKENSKEEIKNASPEEQKTDESIPDKTEIKIENKNALVGNSIVNNEINDVKKSSIRSKLSERSATNEKLEKENNYTNGESGFHTNNEDVISNFENKVSNITSGRDSQKFSDVDNMIPIDHLAFSGEIKGEDESHLENMSLNNDIIANFSSDWAQGSFELVIDHCYDCHKHKLSTRHFEYSYVDKFNEIGENLKNVFPNIKIHGNCGKPEYLGAFDVYLKGVGSRLDEKNRYYIYRKINTKKFPTKHEIIDKLIALVMLYGSSVNMQAAQVQYLKAYQNNIPKPFKYVHGHPIAYPEDAEREKQEIEKSFKKTAELDPERTKLCCLNWGCNELFVKVENGPRICTYHPGVWQFGSYHAYWPEAWSCCEGKWNDPGCVIGPHKGERLSKRLFLCVNHGDINSKTSHPDSACGAYFTLSDTDLCKFHPGYIKNSTWTCCSFGKEITEGCFKGKHATASWPNELAKLYFYPKPLENPGLGESAKSQSIGQLVAKCDFFKAIKPYDNPATKLELLKLKREKEKDEPRYCLRWACEKIYKHADNHSHACVNHPGKWDHGSTGTKLVDFIKEHSDPKSMEKTTILWEPHWTCCRKGWDSPGCKRTAHRGPVLEEYLQNHLRKYKWPDVRLKLYFPKVISEKWKNFLNKCIYSEEKVKEICKKFFIANRYLTDIPRLCDSLRLYLLVVSDNVEYQMKFMDVANQCGSVSYFMAGNYADKEKFVRWWFSSYEKIYEEISALAVAKK